MKLPKVYKPQEYEKDIYKLWEDSNAFSPSKGKKGRYSIVLPPPNATGQLHVGHSAMIAVEDAIVRYQRMQGKSVLWIPGTDHAAIATESVVLRQLEEQGTKDPRNTLGREKVLQEIEKFVDTSIDTIRGQVKAMGASVDWSRERYTMEPAMNRVVNEVFLSMFSDELIYRGARIVNWDPKLQTTVADDELEYKDEVTKFYTFKYGPFEIGTARPETKFGDKYVVMHPDDKRYAKYKHGDTFEAEWINGKITATVIKDESVDPEFGTGVMTITPWHDMTDFDIAERHKLDKQQIIDYEGKLLKVAGNLAGETIEEARPKIVEKLKEKGLLVKIDENYKHSVAVNYRGKGTIEPQIMEQWFVDVNKEIVHWKGKKRSLKQIMQMVVKDGDIKILPKRFEKVYFHWIDNLRDWCISRQIWWGHRIPVWYNIHDKNDVRPGIEPPEEGEWEQDPDTLDTWFSSGLWSWSTLIDPDVALDPKNDLKKMMDKSPDFKDFHPNDLMETGYDILFFWVARMILMTTYATGEIPFKTVYLHGLVRTKDGAKMSKSHPETMIDPLDMINKYGTDALRLSLTVGQAPGHDSRIFDDKVRSFRNFCNKLWNIARYVEDKVGDEYHKHKGVKPVSDADHWVLSQLNTAVDNVNKDFERYELGKAYEHLYHFIWDDFADWYIEASKTQYNASVLVYVLENILKLTHPFAPFVTETIWDTLKWEKTLLIESEWPEVKAGDKKQTQNFDELKNIVSEIRHLRTQLQLRKNTLYYNSSEFVEKNSELLTVLAGLDDCVQVEDGNGLHLTRTKLNAWLDVDSTVMNEYVSRLKQDQKDLENHIKSYKGRLDNKAYVKNAPKEVVEETKAQMAEAQDKLKRLAKELDYAQSTQKSL